MFGQSEAFSSFSVDSIAEAKQFYGGVLGLDVSENAMGMLDIHLATGGVIMAYSKDDHTAASYTVLNFPVSDIDEAIEKLAAQGVVFEQYDDMTDEKGVARGLSQGQGPDIAWFKDPAGNIVSVLQQA
jgi:predicted enzyme related to lactoylglutathione lyase